MTRLLWLAVFMFTASTAAASPAVLQYDVERQILVTFSNPHRPGLTSPGTTWKGWNWSGGYRVGAGARLNAEQFARDFKLTLVAAWPIALLDEYCVVYSIPAGIDRDALISRLQADTRSALVQPLQEFSTTAVESRQGPDPFADLQHGLVRIDARTAHTVTTGKNVRVAIIDTGVQLAHPDIAGRVVSAEDFVERPGDRFDDDIHGTAVAGVIAATSNNSVGISGVAPEANLVILKACWPIAEGKSEARCNSFTLAKALAAAVEEKADVVNLSLIGPSDPLLELLVQKLLNRGIVVIGSLRPSDKTMRFPSHVNGVIAVRTRGSSDSDENSLAAPGVEIMTTIPSGDYQFMSGASFSTAFVTGVVALQRQLNRRLSAARSEQLLVASAQTQDDGSVNACAAVAPLANVKMSCTRRSTGSN